MYYRMLRGSKERFGHPFERTSSCNSILEQADRDDVLRIKEAFCIATAQHQKSLNGDQGTVISDCWKPLLRYWKQQRVARQPTVL